MILKIHRIMLASILSNFYAFQALAIQSVSYEPATVQLSGVVFREQHYGPPGYGENPATDEKVVIELVHLDSPIDVIAKSRSGPDQESFYNVNKVQLSGVSSIPFYNFIGQHVILSGSVFEKEDANHYTNVLIMVNKIIVFPSGT